MSTSSRRSLAVIGLPVGSSILFMASSGILIVVSELHFRVLRHHAQLLAADVADEVGRGMVLGRGRLRALEPSGVLLREPADLTVHAVEAVRRDGVSYAFVRPLEV